VTCIAAVKGEDGSVYIAGDSAGTAPSGFQTIRADEKVFGVPSAIFGFAGSFRVSNLMRYSFAMPAHPLGQSTDAFMRTTFIESVRELVLTKGASTVQAGGHFLDASFLVAYDGRIFEVQADFHVGESADSFAAVGSGNLPALGSLMSTENLELSPQERLSLAMKAAARYNNAVREPFKMARLVP